MSMEVGLIFQIAGIGIILAFIHTVLKELKREDIANWTILVGFVVILLHVAALINSLFDKIKSVFLFQ
ncbi:stage III sporulation protein AC [Ectobacillus antri]|jgi:stage III sporulation protein AC|uniref:Stage III sporulation protein AC n=1 Tax=Ectobacillus antri TaxID=2486280 RepID=A0ABT6H3Z5_9BACI|nr:stage III sporulation protein AC [Ectobacillus antri]MDG4655592.1 stage III sporulation protein AC [Ectobacillus antri]MDG5753350.1 stage III sporulation protein AC [Ectobacillus antri]